MGNTILGDVIYDMESFGKKLEAPNKILEMQAVFHEIDRDGSGEIDQYEMKRALAKLGQSATTLSGGEAQRVKLARELSKRDTGKTLYILDEPTTGLHFHDIEQLLEVIHRLRDHGNTIVVIEHNLDVIKTADWIIDLGPEGGSGGGEIIATGSPEDLIGQEHSSTAQFLKNVI